MKQKNIFSRFLLMAGALVLTLGIATSCGDDDLDGTNPETPQIGDSSNTHTIFVNGESFNMVVVEGGTFLMGSPDSDTEADDDEKPQHSVTLSDYFIGQTEVTQALWKAVMGNNPSHFVGDNLPVETVSWDDCQLFIMKLREMTGLMFRLPTEAEWEFAARGGNLSEGFAYSGSDDLEQIAWYGINSEGRTHEVGTKEPNELGIYDMTGNVDEWVQDWYGDYSGEAQNNPTGPETGFSHVTRGAYWNDIWGSVLRVAEREGIPPSEKGYGLGFRLAH